MTARKASRAMRDPLPKSKGRRRKIGGVQESDLDTIRERRMGETTDSGVCNPTVKRPRSSDIVELRGAHTHNDAYGDQGVKCPCKRRKR